MMKKIPLIHIEVSSFEKSAGKNALLPSVGEMTMSRIDSGSHRFANLSHAENTSSRVKKRNMETMNIEPEKKNNGSSTEKTMSSKKPLTGQVSE